MDNLKKTLDRLGGSPSTKRLKITNPLIKVPDKKNVCTNSSQKSSQLTVNDGKLMLSMLKKGEFDKIDLKSKDEKQILEIASKNIKHIPLDSTDMNTQEFMEFNLDIATRNVQPSCSQVDTSLKKMVKANGSKDVIIVSDSQSNKTNEDSKPSNSNGETHDKANFKCTTDNVKKSESFKETRDSKSSKPDNDFSKRDRDSDVLSFQLLCEKMLKPKSVVGTDNITINNRVVHFNQVNEDVINCVSYTDCASSSSNVKSVIDLTLTSNCNDFLRPLVTKKGFVKRKKLNLSANSPERHDELLQTDNINQRKKLKFNSSPDNNLKNLSTSNSNTTYILSDDEDNLESINGELQKVQKATTTCAPERLIDDSTEANKEEIKPLLVCNPNGMIHKDMLKLFYRQNGQNS